MIYTQKTTKECVHLTPKLAKEYLEHNYTENRSIQPANIARLVSVIETGNWDDNLSKYQDPIIFTDRGVMINGQHRCLAVINSGISVNVWVQFGVHDPNMDLYRNLDSGCVRMARDYINGSNQNSCAAAAKFYVALSNGTAPLLSALQGKMIARTKDHDSRDVSRLDIINAYNADPEYFQTMHKLGRSMGGLWNKNSGAFRDALILIDFVGRGYCIDRFVKEFSSSSSENKTIQACKTYMTRCFCDKNFNSSKKWIIGCVLATYDYFVGGVEASCFNKTTLYLSRYDKYIEQARVAKKAKEG